MAPSLSEPLPDSTKKISHQAEKTTKGKTKKATSNPDIKLPIGGVQKLSLVDYPGHTAAAIFTIGCNMRCGYCHNPELVLPERYLDPIPVSSVLDFLRTRIGKLEGVAISGGEPTMHADLPKLCHALKDMGFLVKLDSNGTHPDMLRDMMKDNLIDFLAMDIKGPLEKYREIVDYPIDTAAIQHSIRLITASGLPHEFRTTIVKSQLSPDDFESIGRLIKGAQRYALQRFLPGKTLRPQFEREESYTEEELKPIKERMERYVAACVIH